MTTNLLEKYKKRAEFAMKEGIGVSSIANDPIAQTFIKANSFMGGMLEEAQGIIYSNFFSPENYGEMRNMNINTATNARGYISIAGNVGEVIKKETSFQSASGLIYEAKDIAPIMARILKISEASFENDIITLNLEGDHLLAKKMTIEIKNLSAEVDGRVEITEIVNASILKIKKNNSIKNNIKNKGEISYNIASVFVESKDVGLKTNLESGAELSIQTSNPNITEKAYVQFTEINGGAEDELLLDYGERVKEDIAGASSYYSKDEVIKYCKEVSGVTRVWVKGGLGTTTVYFMKDNDIVPFPTPQDLNNVKEYLQKSIYPLGDSNDNLFVFAPEKKDYKIEVKLPLAYNDTQLKDLINEKLKLLFKISDFEKKISKTAIIVAIRDAITDDGRITSEDIDSVTDSIKVSYGDENFNGFIPVLSEVKFV